MSKTYHFADKDGYYSHSVSGTDKDHPGPDTILSPPPPLPWDHVWPRWTGTKWVLTEDHRKRDYDRAQDATEYWLPGDKWDSPARTMTEIGPLPKGAVLTAPSRILTADDKAAHLADVRWQAEQGGTEWRGIRVQTDDRSQSKYLTTAFAISIGTRADPSEFKLADGFVSLSNADAMALSLAAYAYVQSCFDAEKAVLASLNTLDTFDAVADAFATTLDQIRGAASV